MSDFRELMSAEMDDAAAGFAAEDFAGGYGRGVVGRVRRRRTARAVGVGGVSAVAVGALAVGAMNWTVEGDPAASGTGVSCVSLADDQGPSMWVGDMGDSTVLASFGQDLGISLTADALTVSRVGSDDDQVIAVRNHQLVGPEGVTDGPVFVTFANGDRAMVDMNWTATRVEVAYGLETEPAVTASAGFPTMGKLIPPGEVTPSFHGIDVSGDSEVRWLLYDDAREQVQAMIQIDGGEATVTFRDGTAQSFPIGDDGIATFTWTGVTTVSLDARASSPALTWGPSVDAPVDQTVTGPMMCNLLGPVPASLPSPSPAS